MEESSHCFSLKEGLEMAVTKDMENNKRPKISLNSKDALKVVLREMIIFEEDGLRGTQLRRAIS
jgi:hypothetical protein